MDIGHVTRRAPSRVEVGNWRTSSYSGANGGNCVEVGNWRTSSYSGGNGGNCVEVAAEPTAFVAVRDSKDRDGPHLEIPPTCWRVFTERVKTGALDPH